MTHGRLVPENVLLDHNGAVRVIGLRRRRRAATGCRRPRPATDVIDLAGCLYAALTGKWAGDSASAVPAAPREGGSVLRPRRVRGGVPRPLDELCAEILCPPPVGAHARAAYDLTTARGVSDYLRAYVGKATDLSDLTQSVPLRPTVLGPAPAPPHGAAPVPGWADHASEPTRLPTRPASRPRSREVPLAEAGARRPDARPSPTACRCR